MDKAKYTAQRISKERIDVVEREIDEIKKRILGEGEQRAIELKTQAKTNQESAVTLIVKKFESEVDNA